MNLTADQEKDKDNCDDELADKQEGRCLVKTSVFAVSNEKAEDETKAHQAIRHKVDVSEDFRIE